MKKEMTISVVSKDETIWTRVRLSAPPPFLKGIDLKKIVFVDKRKRKDFLLNLDDVILLFVVPYYEKTRLHLKLKSEDDVLIAGDFSREDFYKILQSDNEISFVNVCDTNIRKGRIEFHVLDWVSQAMAIG